MNANAEWWYALGNERKGPVSSDHLRTLIGAGVVGPDTLVWRTGMADWRPARDTDLAAGFGPPPLDGAPPLGGIPPQGGSVPRVVPGAGFAGPATPLGTIGFGEAVRRGLGRYATFRGRATRAEFWFFVLFGLLAGLAAGTVDLALFGSDGASPISLLVTLGLLLPQLAVSVRRLHDGDRSGWWVLLAFLPLAGLVLIVFWCLRGTPGPNRFGSVESRGSA